MAEDTIEAGPWTKFQAPESDAGPWQQYQSTPDTVVDEPAPKDKLIGEAGGEQIPESELKAVEEASPFKPPGFFKSAGSAFKGSLESMRGAAGMLGTVGQAGGDKYLQDHLVQEFEKDQTREPPSRMGQAGELVGGLGGSLLAYGASAAATGGSVAGPMAMFGAGGAYDAFRKAGVRALAEGKSPEEALTIAKGASGVGAIKGAVLGALPGGGVIKSALTGGAAMGAGQAVENLAERGLGLETPIMEGVPTAAATGAVVPFVAHGIAKGTQLAKATSRVLTRPKETPGFFTPEERAALKGEQPDAIQERSPETLPVEETSGDSGEVGARAPVEEKAPNAQEAVPKEGDAAKEPSSILLGDPEAQAKWTKATELIKTTEGQAKAEARPVDWSQFYATDAKGDRFFDVPKLRKAIESGELVSSPETGALLLHMLKDSDLHPVESINPLEFTPDEAGLITGEEGGFSGRFRIKKGERTGMIDLVQKADNGEPVSQSDFVHHLTHELLHNNVTSKVRQSPEAQAEIGRLFDLAKTAAKGGEHEGHYGLTNPSDFVAELSDPKFFDFLNSVKDGSKTILQRVIDTIKGLFKLPDKLKDAFGREVNSGTALESLLKVAGKLERTSRDVVPKDAAEFSKTDRSRYEELQAKLQDELKAGRYNTPEFESMWKESEDIKNRNGGMPPAAEGAGAEKWTGATEEKPEAGLGGQLYAGIPNPVAVAKSVAQLAKQAAPAVKSAARAVADFVGEIKKENAKIERMSDLDRSLLRWSGKLQRSFGEASSAQKEIQNITKDPAKLAGLSNWIEARGDTAKLTAQRDATTDPKLRAGYEAALNLSPKEIAIARDVKATYDQLGQRGLRWGILKNFKDDYVTHIWNLAKRGVDFAGGARTLKDKFRFAKARTFKDFFEGEQKGFTPKTKDISKILPVYIHEMNSVIAARQLVEQMGKGKASDGRPLIAPRGYAEAVEGPKGQAVLVKPEAPRGNTADYKELPNQPALHDWVWAGKDTAGNPIFEKSDLVLHPEAYKKLKAILGKSKIKEWYESPGSSTMAIPKTIIKGLDMAQSEVKRTMLTLSPFHQVQEGTHALGHRINPFSNVPKPNLENRAQQDAANHGLMILPDRASERDFMQDQRKSGLVSFIPGVGKLSDWYSHYLFHEYIPGLKIKTYDAVLKRNMEVYAKDLASGEVKPEDVKMLSAEQVNAAYGHLNYAKLGRDPTIQHIARLGLLAPDFLEARARFLGQSLKGIGIEGVKFKGFNPKDITANKVGREQILAMATLAIGQATAAYTMAQLTGGEWDGKHPFEVRKNGRKYTMRSVPEDTLRLLTDTRAFVYNRINPLTAKVPWEVGTGRDWRGQKISAGQALSDAPKALVSLPARGFLGVDRSPLHAWEQLAGSAGFKIMRDSAQTDVRGLLSKWKKASKNPRLVEQAERAESETLAPSDYSELRQALEKEDFKAAREQYKKLLTIKKPDEIKRAMRPFTVDRDGIRRENLLPKAVEKPFLASLNERDRKVYQRALAERRLSWARFQKMLSE